MTPVLTSVKKRIKTLFSEAILVSLIVGFICISFYHVIPAHTGMNGHTSHEVSISNCCVTGGSNHMELWKSTFVGILQISQDLLVLFALAVTAVFTFPNFLSIPSLTGTILSFRYKQYAREHPNIRICDHLRLAFARGILHPKIF